MNVRIILKIIKLYWLKQEQTVITVQWNDT